MEHAEYFDVSGAGRIEHQVLVKWSNKPEHAGLLQIRVRKPAAPAHIWLSGYQGEGLFSSGQEAQCDIDTGSTH